ncbi:MAG: type II toxin-antitoxin system RelB/DinJ family antitoxin [Defluviitaleaceae bacterium]|nr:type II toxin-antitoxin system RelB/DinJ family antitoxin [Defluviitaleaceae bacterium]MCL2239532.1 type II toxin-antitoxin system RelB/DinJ family antitoxin [Defluviitaleaceae bacterium]
MIKKTKLHLLVDVNAAEKADEILTSLGSNINDAVNLMLHQICIKRGLPFNVRQPGGNSNLCAFCPVNDPIHISPSDTPANPHMRVYKSQEEMWADLPPVKGKPKK